MDGGITKEQRREVLVGDFEDLLEATVAAVNRAQPGPIIDDSEEPVRDAAGVFRQKLFARALELRSQGEAFSPSGRCRRLRSRVEEQGHANDSCHHH